MPQRNLTPDKAAQLDNTVEQMQRNGVRQASIDAYVRGFTFGKVTSMEQWRAQRDLDALEQASLDCWG